MSKLPQTVRKLAQYEAFLADLRYGAMRNEGLKRTHERLVQLASQEIYLVTVGQYNVGKSHLINECLAAGLIPEAPVPSTLSAVELRGATKSTRTFHAAGRQASLKDEDAFAQMLARDDAEKDASGYFQIEGPEIPLPPRVVWVEAPGSQVESERTPNLQRVQARNQQQIRYAKKADVLLSVIESNDYLNPRTAELRSHAERLEKDDVLIYVNVVRGNLGDSQDVIMQNIAQIVGISTENIYFSTDQDAVVELMAHVDRRLAAHVISAPVRALLPQLDEYFQKLDDYFQRGEQTPASGARDPSSELARIDELLDRLFSVLHTNQALDGFEPPIPSLSEIAGSMARHLLAHIGAKEQLQAMKEALTAIEPTRRQILFDKRKLNQHCKEILISKIDEIIINWQNNNLKNLLEKEMTPIVEWVTQQSDAYFKRTNSEYASKTVSLSHYSVDRCMINRQAVYAVMGAAVAMGIGAVVTDLLLTGGVATGVYLALTTSVVVVAPEAYWEHRCDELIKKDIVEKFLRDEATKDQFLASATKAFTQLVHQIVAGFKQALQKRARLQRWQQLRRELFPN